MFWNVVEPVRENSGIHFAASAPSTVVDAFRPRTA
jgi:hypothetical protein